MSFKKVVLALAVTCSLPTFAQSQANFEKHLENAAEILIGTWEQKCGSVENTIKFTKKHVTLSNAGARTGFRGDWSINNKDKLILNFDGAERERWTFEQINNNKYTVSMNNTTCIAKRI